LVKSQLMLLLVRDQSKPSASVQDSMNSSQELLELSLAHHAQMEHQLIQAI
jgi:hypothetical protein